MDAYAVFGISDDGLNLVVNLLLLSLVVFWIALIYWTYADASRRMEDPMLVGCATAASIFPFVGTLVYMIVRPPEYLADVRERDLEIAAAEVRLATVERLTCPQCANEIERAFLRCPHCQRRLKEPCATCGKPLDARWTLCPYCEADVGVPRAAKPQPRERPRERAPSSGRAEGRPVRDAATASERNAREAGSERPAREREARKPAARQARPAGSAGGTPRSAERPVKAVRKSDGAETPRERDRERGRPGGERVRPKT